MGKFTFIGRRVPAEMSLLNKNLLAGDSSGNLHIAGLVQPRRSVFVTQETVGGETRLGTLQQEAGWLVTEASILIPLS